MQNLAGLAKIQEPDTTSEARICKCLPQQALPLLVPIDDHSRSVDLTRLLTTHCLSDEKKQVLGNTKGL